MDLHLHEAEYLLLCGFFSWKTDTRELRADDEESIRKDGTAVSADQNGDIHRRKRRLHLCFTGLLCRYLYRLRAACEDQKERASRP